MSVHVRCNIINNTHVRQLPHTLIDDRQRFEPESFGLQEIENSSKKQRLSDLSVQRIFRISLYLNFVIFCFNAFSIILFFKDLSQIKKKNHHYVEPKYVEILQKALRVLLITRVPHIHKKMWKLPSFLHYYVLIMYLIILIAKRHDTFLCMFYKMQNSFNYSVLSVKGFVSSSHNCNKL